MIAKSALLSGRSVIFALLGFAAATAFAQDPTNLRRGRGVPTAYATDQHDAVNLFNGNYSFSIPIGDAYPVSEALSYALSVQYNSNVWDFDWGPEDSVNALPDLHGNAGLGWNLGLARMILVATPSTSCTSWILVEADGSRRQLFDRLHAGDSITAACYTRDGSYLRIKAVAPNWEVESPNGIVRVFATDGRLKTIRDRFSNWVEVTPLTSPKRWQLTDSTGGGRIHYVEFETVSGLPERVKKVELAQFGTSNRAAWTFGYTPATIARHWKHSSDDVKGGLPNVVQVQLLTSVAPPTGAAYAMTYYLTNDNQPPYFSHSGAMKSLRLPTKGKYEYKYRTFSFGPPPSSAPWTAQSDALGSKTVFSANGTSLDEWLYWQGPRPDGTVPANPARELRTWVRTPEHHDVSVHFFTTEDGSWKNGLPFTDQFSGGGGRFLAKRIYEGDPLDAGDLVRSEWVKYNADYHAGSATGRENQRLETQRIQYNDDDDGFARYAEVTLSSFDGLGHYRTATTGGNFGNGDVSSSTTNFIATAQSYVWDANDPQLPPSYAMFPLASPWVLDRFDFQQVTEGTSTFRSDFAFDAATGFLTSIRKRKTAGALNNDDVLAFFCLDPTGKFLNREAYYGGDIQSLAGVSPSCGGAGPSGWTYRIDHGSSYGQLAWSQHRQNDASFVPHRIHHVDIDQWTGRVKSSYDVSGYKTNYDFDALGRLLKVEPVGNGGGEKAAVTNYSWGSGSGVIGLQATIQTVCPSGVGDCAVGASFGESVISWDGFGRVTRETSKQPDGTLARRDTFWNALGWMTQTSVLGPNTGSNSPWVFYDFDAFGRPRKIDLPDKSIPGYSNHVVQLGYSGDRLATRKVSIATNLQTGAEAEFETTHTFDRQGRLIQIQQPLSSGTLKTDYGYNAAGALISVAQGTPAGPAIQSRSMTIDGRGFLTQENHPEKGGAVAYSAIDARGHAHLVDDVGSTGRLSVVIDKAERVTSIWEGSSPSRVLKEWTFGAVAGPGLGKLATAVRYNYFPAIANTAIVTETYGYGGALRLPTSRSTQLFVSALNRERFDQTFTWNRDGTLDQQSYPRCFEGGCGSSGVAGRTVDYNFKEGFLTEIPSFTTVDGADPSFPIEYHPSGMMKTLRHANQVVETIEADPSGLPRRTNLTLTSPLLNGSIGAHAYDGAGNLKTQGLNDFTYDGGSRLVSAFLGVGAHNKTQEFAMDLVGNVTTITTNGSGLPVPTASASNRLNGGGVNYDSRGNLLDWNQQHYEYDRLNKMTRSCATWNLAATTCTSRDWLHVYTADDERMWQYRVDAAGSIFTLRGLDRKVLRTHDSSQGVNAFTDAVWANGRLLTTVSSAGAKAHWHTDELGTPIAQTNPAGALQTSYAYFPYGEEINQTSVDPLRFRFTAHERDLGAQPGTSDDRDYMHQRSTLPQLGRFLSVDPIGGRPGNPQSWNRYAYVLNNPLRYVDPLGLLEWDHLGATNGENGFSVPGTGGDSGGGGGGGGAGAGPATSPAPAAPVEPAPPARCTNAVQALQHFMGGSEKPLSFPFADLGAGGVNLNDFPGFARSAFSACKRGSCSYSERLAFTTSGPKSLFLGDVTLSLQGTFSSEQGQSWTFDGSMGALDDIYDFNRSTHRSAFGEALTAAGREIEGAAFHIEFEGTKPVTASGACP